MGSNITIETESRALGEKIENLNTSINRLSKSTTIANWAMGALTFVILMLTAVMVFKS